MIELSDFKFIFPNAITCFLRYVLDEHEHLLSLKVVMLTDNYNQMTRRPKPYLVIGTASLEGEDTQCKGRVRFLNDDTIVTALFLILRAMLTSASFVPGHHL